MSEVSTIRTLTVTPEMLRDAEQFLTPPRKEERVLGALDEYGRTLLAAHLTKVRELHTAREYAEWLEGREPPVTDGAMKVQTRKLRLLRAEVAALFAELRLVAFRTVPEAADDDVIIFRSGWRIVSSTRAIIRDEERSDTATALWFRNDIAFS